MNSFNNCISAIRRNSQNPWYAANVETISSQGRYITPFYIQDHRNANLKYNYGLSRGAFEFLSCLQLGRCGICNREKKLVVDHNHKTNEIRGLLCMQCNTFVGIFEGPLEEKIRNWLQ